MKKLSFQERANAFNKDVVALQKKYKITSTATLTFPNRPNTPFLSRIAIAIIQAQGGLLGLKIASK